MANVTIAAPLVVTVVAAGAAWYFKSTQPKHVWNWNLWVTAGIAVAGVIMTGTVGSGAFNQPGTNVYRSWLITIFFLGYPAAALWMGYRVLRARSAPEYRAAQERQRASAKEVERHTKQEQGTAIRLLIQQTFEFAAQGRYTMEWKQNAATQHRDEYLTRSAAIEKAYWDSSSPTFDDEARAATANFAKLHLAANEHVRSHNVDEIIQTLAKFHRYEWDILELARRPPPPAAEPQRQREFEDDTMQQFADKLFAFEKDKDAMIRKARDFTSDRKRSCMADEALTDDEKAKEVERIDREHGRMIEMIQRQRIPG